MNPKAKGSAFERDTCKKLSLWVSGGTHTDLFWRSAMSGGRATVGRKSGKTLTHQAGDISAVHPDGHQLTDVYYVECKFYKNLELGLFLFGRGTLARFWLEVKKSAEIYDRRPWLLAKQNRLPTLLILENSPYNNDQLFCGEIQGLGSLSVFDFEKVLLWPFGVL